MIAADARTPGRWRVPGRMVPPAHSPVGPWALARAAGAAAAAGDPRVALAALLARTHGAARVQLWASGTDALRQALEVALPRAGARRVGPLLALPAFTCYAVATAAVGTGVGLVCYDLDPETLSPDPASLERAVRAGAGVIVVGGLFGLPIDWEPVRAVVRRHGCVVVEDAAQGFAVDAEPADVARLRVLSFGRGKGWTGGRGGALLTYGPSEPAAPAGPVRAADSGAGVLARSAVQWALGRPSLYGLPARIPWLGVGETRYHPPAPVRAMPRAAAALALATRPAALSEAERRRVHARWLIERLDEGPNGRPVGRVREAGAAYLRLPFLTTATGARLRCSPEARALGALPSYPLPLSSLAAVAAQLATRLRAPGAELLAARLLTLPTHSLTREDDRAALVRLLLTSS